MTLLFSKTRLSFVFVKHKSPTEVIPGRAFELIYNFIFSLKDIALIPDVCYTFADGISFTFSDQGPYGHFYIHSGPVFWKRYYFLVFTVVYKMFEFFFAVCRAITAQNVAIHLNITKFYHCLFFISHCVFVIVFFRQ